jgi:integrase
MRLLPSNSYGTDIRRTIRGERWRLAISLGTQSRAVARLREAALVRLIDAGEFEILERIRSGQLIWPDLDAAFAPRGPGIDALRILHPGVTMEEATTASMEALSVTNRSSTLRSIKSVHNELIRVFGASTLLHTITQRAAMKWLHSSGAPRTQARKHVYASRVWKAALKIDAERAASTTTEKTLSDNIWQHVSPQRIEKTSPTFLTIEETHAMLSKLKTQDMAWLGCGFLATLRIGETSYLRWDDVDLIEGVIHIQPHSRPHAWRPKTDNSIRNVRIPRQLRTILNDWRTEAPAGAYVFGASTPVPPSTAFGRTRRAFAKADMVGWTYHSGRHSAISNALRAGVPVSIVAAQAGDTEATIYKHYSHVIPKDAEWFSEVLSSESDSDARQRLRVI